MPETINVPTIMKLAELTAGAIDYWIRKGWIKPVKPIRMLGSRPRYQFRTDEVLAVLVARGYRREELEAQLVG